MRSASVGLGLLMAPAGVASAQPAEGDVVVTIEGDASDRGRQEGRATSRVDRKAMEERVPRSAPDALRYEPGVFVQQTAHGQGSPFVRGRTGQQTVLLFDGIRLSNSSYRQGPNQYFFTIDARTIHSIEVVRGGASTLYGSDALGGAIDARPPEPPIDLEASGLVVRPRVATRFATADDETAFRTELGVQAKPSLRLLAGVGSRKVGRLESGGAVENPSDGEVPQVPRFEDDGRTQLGTGFRELTADVRAVGSVGSRGRVVAAAYLYRQYDAPRTDQCPPAFAPETECLVFDEQFRTLVYTSYEGDLGRMARTSKVSLSYQRQHERRTRNRPQSFIENPARDDVDTLGVTAKLGSERIALAPWITVQLQYGGDVYADWLDSSAFIQFTDTGVTLPLSRGQYLAGSTYQQGGAFADFEAALLDDRLLLRTGARVALANANAPSDDASGTAAVASTWPALVGHAGVEVRPAPLLAMLANVDRSYRAPNLDDLTSRQQAGPGFQLENPALEPEHGTTIEGGVRLDADLGEADFWVFRSYLHDAITRTLVAASDCPPQTPQCAASRARFQLVNASGAATIDGVEAASRVFLPAGFTVRATAAYTLGEGTNPEPRPSDPAVQYDERVPLSRIPPPNGTVEARWERPTAALSGFPGVRSGEGARFYLGAALRWALAQNRLAISDRQDARIPLGGTPGFAVVDLRAGARMGRSLIVSTVVENVGDAAYRYHGSSVNGPGRGLVVQIEAGL